MYLLPGCMTATVEYTAESLKGAGNEIFTPNFHEPEHLNVLQDFILKSFPPYFFINTG
jgi:hypothetical protein